MASRIRSGVIKVTTPPARNSAKIACMSNLLEGRLESYARPEHPAACVRPRGRSAPREGWSARRQRFAQPGLSLNRVSEGADRRCGAVRKRLANPTHPVAVRAVGQDGPLTNPSRRNEADARLALLDRGAVLQPALVVQYPHPSPLVLIREGRIYGGLPLIERDGLGTLEPDDAFGNAPGDRHGSPPLLSVGRPP